MKLTRQEKTEINKLLDKFSLVHAQIEILEKNLLELEQSKSQLLTELKSIRLDEDILIKRLKSKYGDKSSLNLETLEIIEE